MSHSFNVLVLLISVSAETLNHNVAFIFYTRNSFLGNSNKAFSKIIL